MSIASASRRGGQVVHHTRLALIAAALVLVVTGVALVVQGCASSSSGVPGPGVTAAQTRAVASFTSLDLTGSNNVTVVVGRPQSVVVHAGSNVIGHVTTQVVAGTLIIGTAGGFTTSNPMSVEVSVPSLAAVKLSGSGTIFVSGIKASRLTVMVSGSGLLNASGTASQLDVTLGGSGKVQLSQLMASDVRAVLSGSGLIQVTATTSLDAEVPGSGAIVYGGNPPQVSTSVTGSGAVTHG